MFQIQLSSMCNQEFDDDEFFLTEMTYNVLKIKQLLIALTRLKISSLSNVRKYMFGIKSSNSSEKFSSYKNLRLCVTKSISIVNF
jgi:hypothetical protein